MKIIFIITLSILIGSCASSKIENRIVNDLLRAELKKPSYSPYLNQEIILLKEAGKKSMPLIAYETLYNNRDEEQSSTWILDSSAIENLKPRITNEALFWRAKEFENFPVIVVDAEANLLNFKTEKYSNTPEKLILTLSKPLKISPSQYLVYFYGRSSIWGGIDRQFVVVMNKSNDVWIPETYYFIEDYFS